jgi:predicted dehydrogenase
MANAREFARRLHIPHWYGSGVELARSREVDCVTTAVVDSGHTAAALAALENRLPVFAEKPLARTLAEAEALLGAAGTAGVAACVNFSKRNVPALELARRIAADEVIGRVNGARFSYLQSWLLHDAWGRWDRTPRWRWRASRTTSTDGVVGDLGSHLIDAILYLLGDIESVSCATTTIAEDPLEPGHPGAPDSFSAVFRAGSGALVAARASWRAAGQLDAFSFEIEGDKGSIAADISVSRDTVRLFDLRAGTWSEQAAPPVPSTYQMFIEAVRRGTGGEPGFPQGVAVQRVLDACARAARDRCTVSLRKDGGDLS